MRHKLPPTGKLDEDVMRAHTHCDCNAGECRGSRRCGCFYCLAIFDPSEIRDWITEPGSGQDTALCPRCGIDAVIGAASGYPVEPTFLRRMERRWFGLLDGPR